MIARIRPPSGNLEKLKLNLPGEAIGGSAFYYACGGYCQD
jgi:hypothetical protein